MNKNLLIGIACLIGLSVLSFSGCPKRTGNSGQVVNGIQFLSEAQVRAAREQNREGCHKYCEAIVSSAGSNNPGCTDSECEKQWLGKKLFKTCEGDNCDKCPVSTDTWYSVYCGELGTGTPPLLTGCKIQLKDIGSCS